MIEYDYELERDEQDVINIYRPGRFPKELPNLVFIEGPNDSGKSTLLNVIALSCYGLKNNYIKESLQKNIKKLVDSDRIKFEVKITNENGDVELFSEKPSFDTDEIILRNKEHKIIAPEQFEKRYRLIYDIPENPTGRLGQLLIDIRDRQLWFLMREQALRAYLMRVIGDIKAARDPDRIENVRNEIRDFESRIEQGKQNVGALEERLKETELFAYVKYYTNYKEKLEDLKQGLKSLQKQEAGCAIRIGKDTKELKELCNQLSDEIDLVEEAFFEVSEELENVAAKKDKSRLSIWKSINVREEFLNPDLKKDLKIEGQYFLDLVEKRLSIIEHADDVQKAQVYRDLLDLLNHYSNLEIEIPAANVTISKFIEILSEELEKHDAVLAELNRLTEAQEQLVRIIQKREHAVVNLIPKIRELGERTETTGEIMEDETLNFQIAGVKAKISKCQESIDYYEAECLRIGLKKNDIQTLYASMVMGRALKELEHYKESELMERISDIKIEIRKGSQQSGKDEANLSYLKDELSKLEKKEPHKYHEHLAYLDETLQEILRMERQLNTYVSYMNQLVAKKIDKKSEPGRAEYQEKVFSYLGKRVGRIKYIDNDYEITKIDMIKESIYTTSGKRIRISDMGTGRGQLAYLTGLLSSSDERKIIALFDEVAMMDKEALELICKKLKALHKSGKLLLGIIVQVAEAEKWRPL